MRPTSISNGRRAPVDLAPLYQGDAGVRETDAGGEISAPGLLPLGAIAFAGTVDGRRVRVLGARPSAIDKRMLVITFEWSDPA